MIGVLLSGIVDNATNIQKLKKDINSLCISSVITLGCVYIVAKVVKRHESQIDALENTIMEIKSKGE